MYKCVACKNNIGLEPIIDLGVHGFADTFLSDKNAEEIVLPLIVGMCEHCFMIQNLARTKATARYQDHEYSYTSSNSKFSRDYWDSVAALLNEKILKSKEDRILEIGSNDGYLLEAIRSHGYLNISGIDASIIMVELAKKRGIKTINAIFNEHFPRSHFNQKFNLIIANNVFNHSDDPASFLRGVYDLLQENGTFIYEVPYWGETITSGHFDQIYHEHVTYHTVTNAKKLLNTNGFDLMNIEFTPYHGQCLRVYAKKIDTSNVPSINVYTKIKEEEPLHSPMDQRVWANKVYENRLNGLKSFHLISDAVHKRKQIIFGIGAAAKANTFLSFYGLTHKEIDFITDASPQKIGKVTPLTRIPIVDDSYLDTIDLTNVDIYAILLSWNLEFLKPKLLERYPNIKFLNFFGE